METEKERQIAINHFNLGYNKAIEEVEKMIDEKLKEGNICIHDLYELKQRLKEKKEK